MKTSDKSSDNKWERVTRNDNKWQWGQQMAGGGITNESEREQIK